MSFKKASDYFKGSRKTMLIVLPPQFSGFLFAHHSVAPGLSPKRAIFAFISKICAIFVM